MTHATWSLLLVSAVTWLLVSLAGVPASKVIVFTTPSSAPSDAAPRPSPARAPTPIASPPAPSSLPPLPPLPRSLAGTEVDGALELDGSGHFIADRAALRLFDYFLAAEGEEPIAELRARVAREAVVRLPPSEVDAALALFDRYVEYRRAVPGSLSGVARGDLRGALAAVHELRVARFGADDAERLFAHDERRAAELLPP
jgi:hypothetical protein